MEELRKRLKTFYKGDTLSAHRFRYTLLTLDITTVIFIIISSFFERNYTIQIIELFLGLYILCDFAARVFIRRRRLRFLLSPYSILDVVVIASFLAPYIGHYFAFLRVISALRLLRSYVIIKRLRKDFKFFRTHELVIQSGINLLIFIFVMTELVYQSQHLINKEINNFVDAMYYTIATLTTTGFGDIVLVGTWGRLIAIFTMIFGVSLFIRLIQTIFRPNKVRYECTSCGLYMHDRDAVHCKACGVVLNIPDDGAV